MRQEQLLKAQFVQWCGDSGGQGDLNKGGAVIESVVSDLSKRRGERRVILMREAQSWKTPTPMEVTPGGRVRERGASPESMFR